MKHLERLAPNGVNPDKVSSQVSEIKKESSLKQNRDIRKKELVQ